MPQISEISEIVRTSKELKDLIFENSEFAIGCIQGNLCKIQFHQVILSFMSI